MSALTSLSPPAAAFYDSINGAASPDQLDNLARAVWHHWGKGEFGDDEASFLSSAIDNRRPLGRRASSAPGAVSMKPLGRLHGRLGSRFTPRQRQRSPDRKASRDRRRRLGGSSVLPDTLRHHYTEGQRAVLCIIAGEVKHHGECDLPIDKIAALAGVCRTTVQTTLHEARRLNHIRITERPVPGRKHLPNLIEIASAEWRTWLKRGPSAHRPIGSKTLNLVSTTKNTDLNKEEERGFAKKEVDRWWLHEPIRTANGGWR
ncbi:MAG: hypothetical protein Q8M19_06940 [Reyranella sp.]|nr:hypothetical protein [Reyranella sp.]